MPIFRKNGKAILYVHVPKTGGTSIEQFFIRNGFAIDLIDGGGPRSLLGLRKCSPQHFHRAIIGEMFEVGKFDFVFMTVRHPLSRLISEFRMRVGDSEKTEFGRWFSGVMEAYVKDTYLLDNHIRPQHEFWIPDCAVYKQEDSYGSSWVERLGKDAGFKFEVKDVKFELMSRGQRPGEDYCSPQTLKKIGQFYREDFDLFGYARDPE